MAAVTTGINHRWVTSSVCLGGNSHVDCASFSASCPCFHSALEDPQKHASKSCFSKGICSAHVTWGRHSRAEPLTQTLRFMSWCHSSTPNVCRQIHVGNRSRRHSKSWSRARGQETKPAASSDGHEPPLQLTGAKSTLLICTCWLD